MVISQVVVRETYWINLGDISLIGMGRVCSIGYLVMVQLLTTGVVLLIRVTLAIWDECVFFKASWLKGWWISLFKFGYVLSLYKSDKFGQSTNLDKNFCCHA